MKKILVALLFGITLLGMEKVFAANQPQRLGLVSLLLSSGTVNQITNSSAPAGGFPMWCTDCIQSPLCVSTGSVAFQWATAGSTSTASTTLLPCR